MIDERPTDLRLVALEAEARAVFARVAEGDDGRDAVVIDRMVRRAVASAGAVPAAGGSMLRVWVLGAVVGAGAAAWLSRAGGDGARQGAAVRGEASEQRAASEHTAGEREAGEREAGEPGAWEPGALEPGALEPGASQREASQREASQREASQREGNEHAARLRDGAERVTSPTSESELHGRARRAARRGAEKVSAVAQEASAAAEDGGPSAAELFARGNVARDRGEPGIAEDFYAQLVAVHPRSSEARVAELNLGLLCLGALARPAEALARFEAYMHAHPDDELVERAWVGKADALAQLGRDAEERTAWQALLERWPDSLHAARARRRIDTR